LVYEDKREPFVTAFILLQDCLLLERHIDQDRICFCERFAGRCGQGAYFNPQKNACVFPNAHQAWLAGEPESSEAEPQDQTTDSFHAFSLFKTMPRRDHAFVTF
jgi:hypothetical protein